MNRKFDKLGRIVIPIEMRDKLNLNEPRAEAKIELVDDKIILTNPNQEDPFRDWLKDYALKTEIENIDINLIQKKYQELKK